MGGVVPYKLGRKHCLVYIFYLHFPFFFCFSVIFYLKVFAKYHFIYPFLANYLSINYLYKIDLNILSILINVNQLEMNDLHRTVKIPSSILTDMK